MTEVKASERLKRLTASPWWAAASFLLIVVAISAMWLRKPETSATLCYHVRSPGVIVSPEDGEVFLYATGDTDSVVTKGPLGKDLVVAAGHYDARIVFQRLSTERSQWVHNINLEAGRRVVREVVYSAGELSVNARVGGTAVQDRSVVVYVFRPEDHDQIVASMQAGGSVLIPSGRYDLRVVLTADSAEKDVKWVRDCQVQEGLRTEHQVFFNRGTVAVRATNGDDKLPQGAVELTVIHAGDVQEEVVETGLAGTAVALPVGNYDIKATFAASHDKPVRWLRGLEVQDGEPLERSVAFSSGGIFVEARLQGGELLEPFAAYAYYYRSGDHQQAVAYAPAGEHVVLQSGAYNVRVEFFRSHDRPDIWLRNIRVTPGEVTGKSVEFHSGKLLIRAYDEGGRELVGDNVFVYVYPPDERERFVAKARSGQQIILMAGSYDICSRNTRRPEAEIWRTGVELRSGVLTEDSVVFPDPQSTKNQADEATAR